MAVDGVLAQHQPRCDLAVCESLRDEAQDLELARRQDLIAVRSACRLRRRTEGAQKVASPRGLTSRPDLVEPTERKRRLANGRVLAAQEGIHPCQLEPCPRELEGPAARGEQIHGVLELSRAVSSSPASIATSPSQRLSEACSGRVPRASATERSSAR